MTGRADFTEQEWDLILSGPPMAGMIVVTAQRGGTFRETIAMAKAYAEARQHHGESELLDEIVSAKPERDHTRFHSFEELKQHGLQQLRDAVALLQSKATPDEVAGYRGFVLTLVDKVANAHREHGQNVSDAEQAAIGEISAALGSAETTSPASPGTPLPAASLRRCRPSVNTWTRSGSSRPTSASAVSAWRRVTAGCTCDCA